MFEDRIILDEYSKKSGLRSVLDNGTMQDILNYLLDCLISNIPYVGTYLSYAFNVGTITYDFMSNAEVNDYRTQKIAIENTNQYIIGEHYWHKEFSVMIPDPINNKPTGYYKNYSKGSGRYYGKQYQRGQFIEAFLKI